MIKNKIQFTKKIIELATATGIKITKDDIKVIVKRASYSNWPYETVVETTVKLEMFNGLICDKYESEEGAKECYNKLIETVEWEFEGIVEGYNRYIKRRNNIKKLSAYKTDCELVQELIDEEIKELKEKIERYNQDKKKYEAILKVNNENI